MGERGKGFHVFLMATLLGFEAVKDIVIAKDILVENEEYCLSPRYGI
jgi:hypothetical protein